MRGRLCYDNDMKRMYVLKTRRLLCAILALFFACMIPAGLAEAGTAEAAELEVYFLDLGRVDGILIRCGGENCFIDVGFMSDAKKAIRWLKAMGITHLNSYVGTHGHSDHIDGAAAMIEAFQPDVIYVSHVGCLSVMLENATEAQQAAITAAKRAILVPGDSFGIGPATMNCLGPLTIARCNIAETTENQNSLVLRLDYGARRMLFTSDTTDPILHEIEARQPGCLRADVLKNPHHNASHEAAVIDMIAPRYVVFCTDNSNAPRESYLQLLAGKGIRTLCLGSNNQGSVAVITDGQSLEIRCGTAVQVVTIAPIPDLYPGQQLSLNAAVDPAEALVPDRQLGWNCSDEGVARVDKGRLLAVAPGEVTVTAVAINGVSASARVRVMDAAMALEETAVTLAQGETRALKGQIMPASAQGLAVEWTSEDEGVAVVFNGSVTATGEGSTRILAQLSNGALTWCDVTVKGQIAHSVKVSPRKATLKVGESIALTATVDPAWYDTDNLEWESSDESVLWVDGYGNVTAARKGKAKITVVAADGVYDVCTIKVTG